MWNMRFVAKSDFTIKEYGRVTEKDVSSSFKFTAIYLC